MGARRRRADVVGNTVVHQGITIDVGVVAQNIDTDGIALGREGAVSVSKFPQLLI